MIGEGVAFVAAETAVHARDAAEAVDYAPLPACTDMAAARLDGDSGGAQRKGGVTLRAPNGLRNSSPTGAAPIFCRQTAEIPDSGR